MGGITQCSNLIECDNGVKFTSYAMFFWQKEPEVSLHVALRLFVGVSLKAPTLFQHRVLLWVWKADTETNKKGLALELTLFFYGSDGWT
jgi:hypothetical protein